MATLALALVLSGCGQSNEAKEGEEKKPKAQELTVKEVIDKANEAMKDVKGLSFETKGKQKSAMQGMKMEMDLDLKTEMTYKPLVMYAKGKSPTGIDEMYMEDDMMYMKEDDGWIKVKADGMEDLLGLDDGSKDPKAKLEDIEKMSEHYKVSYKDGTYVLELDATDKDDEKIRELILKSELSFLDELTEELEAEDEKEFAEFMKGMKFNAFKQTFWFDEKTFEITKIEQMIKIEMNLDEMEVELEQEMTMTITGKVDQVTVPEEVKKKAKLMKEEDFEEMFDE